MVAHFTLRTYDVNKVFFRKKSQIWWLFRCNQMPSTNRTAWFTPCVRIVKWATIYYKNHGIWYLWLCRINCQVSSYKQGIYQGTFIRWQRRLCCARVKWNCGIYSLLSDPEGYKYLEKIYLPVLWDKEYSLSSYWILT